MQCSTNRVDTGTMSCLEAASALLQAYYAVISGRQRISVRFGERWTDYHKANAEELRTQYQTLYNQCPECRTAGLPNLNPGLQSRRGPPLRGFTNIGRM